MDQLTDAWQWICSPSGVALLFAMPIVVGLLTILAVELQHFRR